jgi:hypothetical protein
MADNENLINGQELTGSGSDEAAKPAKPAKPAKAKEPELTPEQYLQERVPIKLFKDNNKYKDDVVVGVNGKTWRIMRGVEVMVPRFVKNVLDNSEIQMMEAYKNMDTLQNELAQAEQQGAL